MTQVLGQRSAAEQGQHTGAVVERQVTMFALVLAASYVASAIIGLLVPSVAALGTWLPLHLLLAGAAGTAIAGVMPFFSATVTGVPAASRALRLVAVILVAFGALTVIFGRVAAANLSLPIAGLGGIVYLAGMVAVLAAALLPLRRALGARRVVIGMTYGIAVADVIGGVLLATLFLLNWSPVVQAWAVLKPAHAWLNLFGFVSLAIAGSLLHLLPTVADAHSARSRASVLSFAGLATGPLITAIGFVLRLDAMAILGAALTTLGALALGVHALGVLRHHPSWTADRGWHRFTTWSLAACVGWFTVGTAIAALTVLRGGASAAGWQLDALVAPLGLGWVMQALMGAWSYVVPAVGPGSVHSHLLQRITLGRAGTIRPLILNVGVLLMVVGQLAGSATLVTVGLALAALASAVAVGLLVIALGQSRAVPSADSRQPSAAA